MKVLFVSRSTLYSSYGGDTVQIENTAKYLRRLGVEVDISIDGTKKPEDYDIVHFFNMIRPDDIIGLLENPISPVLVVSPIYVDYSESERLSPDWRRRATSRLLGRDSSEYIKAMLRCLRGNGAIKNKRFLFTGQRASIRFLLSNTCMLLPNSESELERVRRDYGYTGPARIVPNAIDTEIFDGCLGPDNVPSIYEDAVICVGRIEYRKNQLALIEALNGTGYKVFIIGNAAPNQSTYYEKCRGRAMSNITFIGHMEQQYLAQIYRKARVHVLPSYFETTGLVSLEAAYCGCRIVVTDRGDQKEYFQGLAEFCSPDDVASIRAAVDRAYRDSSDLSAREIIKQKYTWATTAVETLSSYQYVLESNIKKI
jgi:glycosyltransferase involved in cell wall biosynthesis